MYTKIFISN